MCTTIPFLDENGIMNLTSNLDYAFSDYMSENGYKA